MKRLVVSAKGDSVTVRLKNVRLSFPAVFNPTNPFNTENGLRYRATFIMDKEGDLHRNADNVRKAVDLVKVKAFPRLTLTSDKLGLRDGADKPDTDGYGDTVYFINTSCKNRPPVVNRDRSPIAEDDNIIYAGCYVNASIRIWALNDFGQKRICAALRAIQFANEGDAFGESVDVESEFDVVAGAEEVDDGIDPDKR